MNGSRIFLATQYMDRIHYLNTTEVSRSLDWNHAYDRVGTSFSIALLQPLQRFPSDIFPERRIGSSPQALLDPIYLWSRLSVYWETVCSSHALLISAEHSNIAYS
jgi:hypothetical protein